MGYQAPKIKGWMSKTELRWLYKTARYMSSIAEVGSYRGKSTHALLSGCPGMVYAIDHWNGIPGVKDGEGDYDEFIKSVGHFKNLVAYRMLSKDAAQLPGEYDMVFIDADHSYSAVREDIINWLPKAKKIICGHDYDTEGVALAVKETLGEVGLVGSIWIKHIITNPYEDNFNRARRNKRDSSGKLIFGR